MPTLALGLLGGTVLDAVDRRKLVLACSSALAVVSAALAALAFAGLSAVWPLYLLVAVESAISAVNVPARRTFVARLLPADRRPPGSR